MTARRAPHAIARALMIGCIAFASAGAQNPAAWTDAITPFRLIDNVHYVGSAGLAAYLITTPKGHILLDVGLPENATMVARNIVRLGFALRDVRILLNSHAHFDHAGGLAALKRRTGARLYAMQGDTAALQRGVYIGSESNRKLWFPRVTVDSVLADGDGVSIGGLTLTANLTAGHTAGCTSWTMPVTVDGTRHTAVFFCSASVALNRLAPRPQYAGIVDDYRRAFARFETLEADVFFAAHAEQFDLHAKRARLTHGGPNPFIDAGALRRVADTFETAFEKELARQQTLPR